MPVEANIAAKSRRARSLWNGNCVIGQFTADSRIEPKFNAHLPIRADDLVDIWYTPTD